MSANAIIRRLEKLEAVAPAPPSLFDGMTIDEMSVWLLEECAEMPELQEERDRVIRIITATVNFASGRWALAPCFKNYQEHIASEKAYWERLQSTRGEYVPSLNHEIETDGFPQPGRGEPAAPDLMGRRAKLWQHPIVKQIVNYAPAVELRDRTSFRECGSFRALHPSEPSAECWPQCARQCVNARWGQ